MRFALYSHLRVLFCLEEEHNQQANALIVKPFPQAPIPFV
jgi:hypothetical protein